MSYRTLLILLFVVYAPLALSAQTAAELDVLLETREVSAAQAARFVLGAVGMVPEELSGGGAETAAHTMARSKGWVTGEMNDAITLKETAFLVMNAFGLKGGLFYSIAHNSRYAYRELIYRKLIQGRADPGFKVSGIQLLQIIGRTLNYTGEDS